MFTMVAIVASAVGVGERGSHTQLHRVGAAHKPRYECARRSGHTLPCR